MIAFITPRRRKSHLATTVTGAWQPLCNAKPAPFDTTDHQSLDAARGSVDVLDESVCVHCLRMIAFARIIDRFDLTGDGARHLMAVAS